MGHATEAHGVWEHKGFECPKEQGPKINVVDLQEPHTSVDFGGVDHKDEGDAEAIEWDDSPAVQHVEGWDKRENWDNS